MKEKMDEYTYVTEPTLNEVWLRFPESSDFTFNSELSNEAIA